MPKLLVMGSLNLDLVLRLEKAPAAGETVYARSMERHPGGKGANQAHAAARFGADVDMAGAVGTDDGARLLLDSLQEAGVGLQWVERVPGVTGTAYIQVDAGGENRIILLPGANGVYTPERAAPALDALPRYSLLLLQQEIPAETVAAAAQRAAARGVPVWLNAAPARPLSPEVLTCLDALVVNEIEGGFLLGQSAVAADEGRRAVLELARLGPRRVVLTLGEAGSWLAEGGRAWHQPAFPVTAVDTTAAGDTFVGVLAAATLAGWDLAAAARLAAAAAAVSVTRPGAQPSQPTREEVGRAAEAYGWRQVQRDLAAGPGG